ncbi:MAG: GntR family transcriptional regulator [Anaerolineales bacterium]|nr:MAG: GntR family transcriptional regulator [Anaerolineales bacterium]
MRIVQSKSIVDQIEEILRNRIRDATYVSGGRIPSESELSEEFGVSRATVRTVLAKLAVSGLILRKHGDGTYVNPRIRGAGANVGNLWDFATLIESNGYTPLIEALSIELRAATEKESAALALEPQEKLLSMTRLFHADDQPVILANNVIPASFLHTPIEQIDGHVPIREILRKYCSQEIAFAITDIRSVLVEDEVKVVMGDELNKTMLELQLAFYSRDNLPLALGVNYFNDSILRLSLVQAWN